MEGVMLMDALAGVSSLGDRSVQVVVTSPPYYRQRDYGYAAQWGQEGSPGEYVSRLVKLFAEVRRALHPSGTVWMVLGDSYASYTRGGQSGLRRYGQTYGDAAGVPAGVKRKDLLGVPWQVAFALRDDGWFLRQDIIWAKPNPMVESVRDRCTRSHEYIFMLSKSPRYYYDHLAIATPLSSSTVIRSQQNVAGQRGSNRAWGRGNRPMKASFTVSKEGGHGRRYIGNNERGSFGKVANRRSVWTLATAMSREDHYASFPGSIPDLCIRAGSRPGDLVLDPFAGTGTTLLQASVLGRRYVGFDLSEKYVGIARRRLRALEGIFFRG